MKEIELGNGFKWLENPIKDNWNAMATGRKEQDELKKHFKNYQKDEFVWKMIYFEPTCPLFADKMDDFSRIEKLIKKYERLYDRLK